MTRRAATILCVGLAAGLVAGCAGEPSTRLTQAAWCDGFEVARLSPDARMSGANRERLKAAERLVAPGLAETRSISGLSLLGGYQEEMERPRPDVATAATYLATVSAIVITPEVVGQVNGLLCVTTTARRAAEIAGSAARTQQDMVAGHTS